MVVNIRKKLKLHFIKHIYKIKWIDHMRHSDFNLSTIEVLGIEKRCAANYISYCFAFIPRAARMKFRGNHADRAFSKKLNDS